MTQGVYEFETKLNGKAYTGSSVNIERRRREHLRVLRQGKHHSIHFQRAWDLYGEEAFKFVVLEIIEDAERRLATEQKRINERLAAGTSYNMARDVSAPMLGRKHTKETRRKQSKAHIGIQYCLGRELTDETRHKLSVALTGELNPNWGKKHTDEQKQAQSERMMGNQISVGNQHWLGRKHTDASKRKIGAAHKGKPLTEGHKHKLSIAKKQWWAKKKAADSTNANEENE